MFAILGLARVCGVALETRHWRSGFCCRGVEPVGMEGPLEETGEYILLAIGTDTQARIERQLIDEVRPEPCRSCPPAWKMTSPKSNHPS